MKIGYALSILCFFVFIANGSQGSSPTQTHPTLAEFESKRKRHRGPFKSQQKRWYNEAQSKTRLRKMKCASAPSVNNTQDNVIRYSKEYFVKSNGNSTPAQLAYYLKLTQE